MLVIFSSNFAGIGGQEAEMALQALSSETRGFLYGLFNQASNIFKRKADELAPAEAEAARSLSLEFSRAKFDARMLGHETSMSATIDTLAAKVNGLTDAGLKDAADELRDWQKLYFRHIKPQQKMDLGSYSNGIF